MASSPPEPGRPIAVFFSYAHRDEALRNKLADHLRLLERQGIITGWHDRRITGGTEWAGAIDDHLRTAQIILLLISSAFLASDYCYDVEVRHAMARHEAGEARVIPVIVRPVDWHTAPFGRLQALPKDGRPVTRWPNRDEAFLDIARGIRSVAEELAHPPLTAPSEGGPPAGPRLAETTTAPNAAVVDHTDGELRMSDEAIRATRSITVQGGNPAVNRSPDRHLLVQLREFFTEYFSEEELRTVCFDLGIDYHDLRGEGKAGKARELVAYYERHGRILELVEVGRRLRPGVSLGNSADQRISPERVPRSNDVVEQVPGEAPVDVGIIIALREEFRELHLELSTPIVIKDESTGASDYLFQWPVENAQPYYCAATFVGIMGPTEAALATERFLNRRQPKTIVMLGIAAGTSDDVKLGDVIIATHVGRYLDRAKVVSNAEKTFDIRPGGDAFPCSGDLVRASLDFEFAHRERYASWRDGARTQLQGLVEEKRQSILLEKDWLNERPSFLEGPVASGPVVAASKEFVEWVKSTNRNYLALEMEGGAMLAAVYSRAEPGRSLMLRGISDFGDERKEALDQVGKGGLRRYATRNAIRLLWGLLEARVLPRANP